MIPKKYLKDLVLQVGASDAELAELQRQLNRTLPADLLDLFRLSNGVDGPIGPNAYLKVWAAEAIPDRNRTLSVADYQPDLLLIGSDIGGEAYGISYAGNGPVFVEVAFDDLVSGKPRVRGRTLNEFLEYLYRWE